jgi:hypothetical protein
MTTATRTTAAINFLRPFGTPKVVNQTEAEATIELTRPHYRIVVLIDECANPRFQAWENGEKVMDTRDNLQACLEAFNN